MHDWLAMGGYGAYVWTAYAVFVVVLALDAIAPVLQRRRLLSDLRARAKREQSKQATR